MKIFYLALSLCSIHLFLDYDFVLAANTGGAPDTASMNYEIINTSNSSSKKGVKAGIFNFLECEGGIGGATHMFFADPVTNEEYTMTAYRGTSIKISGTSIDICDLRNGTPVKILYKSIEGTDLYMFIKALQN